MTEGFQNISTTDITWKDVQEYINSGELYKLRRSKDETIKYRAHKELLKKENISIIDHILHKLNWNLDNLEDLNATKFPNDNDKLKACFSDKDYFKLLPNDFPYMFEPNIIHLLVWSKIRLPIYLDDHTEVSMEKHNDVLPTMNPEMKDKINKFLMKTLQKKLGLEPIKDYVWFINYTSLQSIRAISHIHLLIRCDDVPIEHSEDTKKAIEKVMDNFLNNDIFETI
ncbi:similar to Saccharomyces cerevisiae YPL067C Putative protein of unknown function [Maudiozyma saulgeensis]|uniref:Uncharacterized protein n=1 Tax=Maudiozyma saulgeensis TaxID=1789683 RepID=A0A1X7R6X5_9SACH|nr:similar to Saccharomyces cerevisiae YPL067C Putative protein of unknown function [Kazachstania saulgeensis]